MLRLVTVLTCAAAAAAAAAVADPMASADGAGREERSLAAAEAARPVMPFLDVYDGQHQTGSMISYDDSTASMGGWNDAIRSACLTGFWIFFEHDQYNFDAGRVLWSFGFNYCFTFKSDFDQQISSIRRIGDFYDAAKDSLGLFEGTYYSGKQVFTETQLTNIATDYGYSSVIVSGPDAWTIYSGDNFTGKKVCLYSGSDSASVNDQTITYGLFPSADYLGTVGADIRSARKGCYSSEAVRGIPLTEEDRLGAAGKDGGVGGHGTNWSNSGGD